jgi:GT2 family glycosyltransferase
MPEISIIIINYNTFDLTVSCLKSVFNKSVSVSIEVILVDNASSECDPQKFKEIFPQIKLIKSESNLGFAKGNNLGIEHASGEYILLLNSDTELINDAVGEAYRIIKEDNSIGVITGQLQYPNGEIQAQAGRFPSITRELRELLRINKLLTLSNRTTYYLGTRWSYDFCVDADWVWGAFFMFRKSNLKYFPNGKLHEDFFMYGEDIQWCYHFKKLLKKRIVYHPAPKIVHYIGGSDQNHTNSFERYKTKMLPNEFKWLTKVKTKLYTKLFYGLKGLHYLTIRGKENKKKSKVFILICFKGI